MKSLKIVLTKGTEKVEANVKSECAMWNYLRKVRNEVTDELLKVGVRAVVTDADELPFKDITFRRNSKGKIEMPNAVKETNRIRVKKEKPAVEKKAKVADTDMDDVLAEAQSMASAE